MHFRLQLSWPRMHHRLQLSWLLLHLIVLGGLDDTPRAGRLEDELTGHGADASCQGKADNNADNDAADNSASNDSNDIKCLTATTNSRHRGVDKDGQEMVLGRDQEGLIEGGRREFLWLEVSCRINTCTTSCSREALRFSKWHG